MLEEKLQLHFHYNLSSFLWYHVGRQTTTSFSLQLVVVSVITGWKINCNYIFIATCCRFGDNMLKDKLQVHFHCNLLSFLGKHVGRHTTTTFSLQLVVASVITCWMTNYNYIFIAPCCRFWENMLEDILQLPFHCNFLSFLGKHVGRHTTTTFSLQLVVVSAITCWKRSYNYISITICRRFGDNMLKDKLQVHFRCNLYRFCDNISEEELQLQFHCNLLSFLW